jgi:biotin transport system substrate-specific component
MMAVETRVQGRRLGAVAALTSRPARRVVAVGLFAAATALAAYITVPALPVPVTMQTLVVILSGALLGPVLGAAAQVTYLLAGAVGAPWFAGGTAGAIKLFGPTGGYLLAFPVAAFLVGVLARRLAPAAAPAARRAVGLGVALVAGSALILLGGWAQLAILVGDPVRAFQLGVLPFVLGDLFKVLLALIVAIRLRARTLGLV